MLAHALLVFACGAIYEAACVGFVHHAEARHGGRTALYSMVAGGAAATGILDSVAHWYLAFALVLGYGAGAWMAIEWNRPRGGYEGIRGTCDYLVNVQGPHGVEIEKVGTETEG